MEEKTDLWLPGAEKLAVVVGGQGAVTVEWFLGFHFR